MKESPCEKTMLILSLFVVADALALRVDTAPKIGDPVDSPRKAKALIDARGVFMLSDGSEWITHAVAMPREMSAIGVTRFGHDGSVRLFLLSDWLPKGSIPGGMCGQVYGVTLLTDGRVVISGGWTDGPDSHNAILILRGAADGRYERDKVIELPGVTHVVGGPRNTILAVTSDANRQGGGPLLTLFDAEGHKIGTGFGDHLSVSAPEAAQNAMKARLLRYSDRDFAFYDPYKETVYMFNVDVLEKGADVGGNRVQFIGDDPATSSLPVLGIDASSNGDLLVARVGRIRGKIGTQLTVYGSDGSVKQSTFLDRPWNLMLYENDRIRGVVLRNGVELDTVALLRDK